MTTEEFYLDGWTIYVPWDEAQIPILTHGLHYASAVFEGERAYDGQVFKIEEHNERLHLLLKHWDLKFLIRLMN